jgi:hypothetical protein
MTMHPFSKKLSYLNKKPGLNSRVLLHVLNLSEIAGYFFLIQLY